MPHLVVILFVFAFGACVGSFLNVVVWRLPRGESLVRPPSHCPVCEHHLSWRDNIPVFGWLFLRGRCRYCFNPISARYPAIEFLTGALFVFYYVMFFVAQVGPCATGGRVEFLSIQAHWQLFALYLFTLSCLLAASLIDLKEYFIPMEIPLLLLGAGIVYHTFADAGSSAGGVGALNLAAAGVGALFALGGGVGLIVSVALLHLGLIRRSFADGYPPLEVEQLNDEERAQPGRFALAISRAIDRFRRKLPPDETATMNRRRREADERERGAIQKLEREAPVETPVKDLTRREIRREMRHEMTFLLFPLIGVLMAFFLVREVPAIGRAWQQLMSHGWWSGLMGAVLGALVGGFVVWTARIVGTLVAGREAMGMGDVHLMFGVGAVIGAGAATVAFFIGPLFGIVIAVYLWLTSTRRELPFGPYLSLGTACVMLFYCPIAAYLAPGFMGMGFMLQHLLSGK